MSLKTVSTVANTPTYLVIGSMRRSTVLSLTPRLVFFVQTPLLILLKRQRRKKKSFIRLAQDLRGDQGEVAGRFCGSRSL
jgi:hypothetical protein